MSLLAALALDACARVGSRPSAADTQISDQGIADLPGGDASVADLRHLPDLTTLADFPAHPDLPGGCSGPNDCDDKRTCTTSTCVAGQCVYTVQTGFCLIAETCVAAGVASPANECLRCDPSNRRDGWSEADGADCDDGISCTYADKCHKGSCQGTVYACNSSRVCRVGSCNGQGPVPGGCAFTLVAGYCLIGDTCYADGARNPQDPCQSCNSSLAVGTWSSAGGCVTTLAGNGTSGGTNGPLAQARFDLPYGIAVDATGKIYVAEEQGHRIRVIDGGQVSTLAGTGSSGFLDGPVATARFFEPRGVCVDPSNGNVYVADTFNHRIRLIAGGQVSTVAGDGTAAYLDGPVVSARFNQPKAVVSNGAGTLYIADYVNSAIRIISGGVVSTLAGNGTVGTSDGVGSGARFNRPHALVLASDGSLYVADTHNNRIRKIDSLGQVTTVAGSVSGFVDGPVSSARFRLPYGLAIDGAGTLYVADRGNHRLRMIKAGMVSTLAGSGSAGLVNGPAAMAQFNRPKGVALGSNGQIYISDHGNHAIRVYSP